MHNYPHSVAAVMRKGFALNFDLNKIYIQQCSFSPSYLRGMYFVHACGARVAILELGAFGICNLSVCT